MSGAAPTAIRPELELAPGVWTDVSTDVVQADQIRVSYGIRDSGPLARVAETGTAMLSLRNDAGNAAGVQGYYSPNHPAARAGFGYGTGFRLAVTSGGTTYYKFRGRIVEIDPVAGQYGLQRTRCRAVDWLEDLAAFQVRRVAAHRDQRVDDLLTTLITAMPNTARPAAQILDRGTEPYPYAFYDLGGGTSGRTVAQKLMQSELGHLAVIGDTTQGGTLRFFNRHHRATADSAVTLPNTMHGLRVPSTIDRAFNDVRVTINPVRVDPAATTVLWALTTEPTSSRPVIPAGQSRTFWGDYHDPDRENQLIGGTDQVAPVATTDYAANAAQDGTGTDLTASFTVTASFFGGSVQFVVTNTAAIDGTLTKLQCRGKAIEAVASLTFEASRAQPYGERSLRLNMPYQVDPEVGQGAATYLEAVYHALGQQVTALMILANDSDTLLTQALAREPGDRITVTETVTGLAMVDAFIQGVDLTVGPGDLVRCTWHLAPAVDGEFWILDDPVASVLGVSTVLGYA